MHASDIRVPEHIRAVLNDSHRPEEDRKRDESRRIDKLLTFCDIRPGMTVADLMASRGYVAGALASAVGTTGVVYAQNSPQLLARFKGEPPIQKRIREQELVNLREVVSELEDLKLPTGQLDVVVSFMFYHDMVWIGANRAAMILSVFRALKPTGIFVVVDHHAPAGAGTSVANETHRIEKSVVVEEVTAIGFILEDETDLLENPADPLDVLVFDKRVKDDTHKFVLKFRKP